MFLYSIKTGKLPTSCRQGDKLNKHVVTVLTQKSDTTLPSRFFEPLWYNSHVTHNRNIIKDTVIQQFISLGITQVKHLCEMKSYEPQFRSNRIFESLKHEITATSLPQHWNDVLHNSSRWETDSVIKHVTDIEISCEKSKLVSLRNPPRKGLYRIAFDYWFSYDDHDPRVWCDILNFEVDRKVYFNNIYDCMLTKK